MKAVHKEIPLDFDREPPVLKFKAPKGWRAVVFWESEVPEGVIALSRELFIAVLRITHFAGVPPFVEPGDPLVGESSTSWGILQPMFGDRGIWSSDAVKFFRIIPPEDKRAKRELVEECSNWISVASTAAKGRRRQIS